MWVVSIELFNLSVPKQLLLQFNYRVLCLAPPQQQLKQMNKWVYFFILLITSQFFIGIQSSYSVVKTSLGEQLDISDDYFGILEMLSMIGRVIGMVILLLVPIRRVSRTYFIFVVLGVLSYLIIMVSHFLPNLKEVFLPIGMIGVGAGRGIYTFPYLLLYECFKQPNSDENSNQTAFNIWFGLTFFGHAYALLLGRWMHEELGLSWLISLYTFTMLYLVTGIITFLVVPENFLETSNENESLGSKICQMMKIIKQYLKKNVSNILLVFDFCFIDNQTSLIVFWIPHFFRQTGFGPYAAWIALTYPGGTMIGSFVVNPLLKKCPQYIPVFTSLLLFLESLCLVGVILLEPIVQNLAYYIVLLMFAYIFLVSPYSRAASTEVSQRTKTKRQNYLAINFMRMARELLSAISVYAVGALMEIEPRNFLYVFYGNSIIALAFHIARRVRQRSEKNREDQSAAERQKDQARDGVEHSPAPIGSQQKIVIDLQANKN